LQMMLVNDAYEAAAGTLSLSLKSAGGNPAARAQRPFRIEGLGQSTLYLDLDVPNTPGDFILEARADTGKGEPTVSRRKVRIPASGK